MFDYQAGEKYKLTLVMVGLAGLMAGMFFTALLAPAPEPARGSRALPAYMHDPDITSRRAAGTVNLAGAAAAMTSPEATAQLVNPLLARSMVEQWLPLAWDLSAGSAENSQEQALLSMTADCAAAYRKNIWRPDLAKQINDCGLKSSFQTDSLNVGDNLADGSVVVYVSGKQTLSVPGNGSNTRQLKLEYMVKMTPQGLRIAGISEGGKNM